MPSRTFLAGLAIAACPLWSAPQAKNSAEDVFTLQTVSIMDSGRVGGEAYRILKPSSWQYEGGVVWRNDPANPASPWVRLHGPRNEEIGVLPPLAFVWNPQMLGRNFPQGSMYAGTEVQPPALDPAQCIERIVIPRYLKNLSRARIVRQEALPELAAVGHMKYPGPDYRAAVFQAGKVRFAFQENGVAMEEDVYVLTAAVPFRVGPTTTTLWSPDEIRYSKAPAGELDRQLAIFQTAMFSMRPNLRWFAAVEGIARQMADQQMQASSAAVARSQAQTDALNRQADARRNAINSAGNQVNDMIMQGYQRRMATQDAIAQNEDRTIRQVQIYQNPSTGEKYELPAGYGSAYLGPNNTYTLGGYNYNPNYASNGSFQRLNPVGN